MNTPRYPGYQGEGGHIGWCNTCHGSCVKSIDNPEPCETCNGVGRYRFPPADVAFVELREKFGQEFSEQMPSSTDWENDGNLPFILNYLLECCRGWEPKARLLGNARAEDIIGAVEQLRADLAALRRSLIYAINHAGGKVSDECSTEFLCMGADQVKLYVEKLKVLLGAARDHMLHNYPCEGNPCKCGMQSCAERIDAVVGK